MKHLLLICAFALSLTANADNVYLCSGPKSRAFHTNPYCMGLKSCSTKLTATSRERAIKLKRRPCRFCVKK